MPQTAISTLYLAGAAVNGSLQNQHRTLAHTAIPVGLAGGRQGLAGGRQGFGSGRQRMFRASPTVA